MINSPESNVQFTVNESERLQIFHSRLSDLQTTIAISEKNLMVVNKELVKASEKREYLETQVQHLDELIAQKEQEFNSLTLSVAGLEQRSVDFREQERLSLAQLADKENALIERTNAVLKAETELDNEKEALRIEASKQLDERKAIDSAREILSTALKSIPWK
jgi:chromosome segregation ATPase